MLCNVQILHLPRDPILTGSQRKQDFFNCQTLRSDQNLKLDLLIKQKEPIISIEKVILNCYLDVRSSACKAKPFNCTFVAKMEIENGTFSGSKAHSAPK